MSAKNIWKMETSEDYTSWDLNCRRTVVHKTKHNELERKFRRKNRRTVKYLLKKYINEEI